MNVSFIIATCRNELLVQKTIDSINALPQNKYSYEICVYSPQSISGKNVVWFKEDELRGPHYGFNYLINRVNGEYVYQLVDDMAIHQDGWEAIRLLESKEFSNRKYKITTLGTKHEPVRCAWPHPDGFMIPNYLCMRFPVIHISTIKNYFQGYFYHPELYYHQADAWMGYWIGETGEEGIECCGNATLHTHGQISYAHDKQDTEKYFDLIRTLLNGNKNYVRDGSTNKI